MTTEPNYRQLFLPGKPEHGKFYCSIYLRHGPHFFSRYLTLEGWVKASPHYADTEEELEALYEKFKDCHVPAVTTSEVEDRINQIEWMRMDMEEFEKTERTSMPDLTHSQELKDRADRFNKEKVDLFVRSNLHLIPDVRSWFECGYTTAECASRFKITEAEVIGLMNWRDKK